MKLSIKPRLTLTEWIDTNPEFSASTNGVWLIEIGPAGPAFRMQDRMFATVANGAIRGGGKFFTFEGEIATTISHLTGSLSVTRIAAPWYPNDWGSGPERFDAAIEMGWFSPNVWAGGELTRSECYPLGSMWHKLSDLI